MKMGYARSPSSTVTVFSTFEEGWADCVAMADTAGESARPLLCLSFSTTRRVCPAKTRSNELRLLGMCVEEDDAPSLLDDDEALITLDPLMFCCGRADADVDDPQAPESLLCIRLIGDLNHPSDRVNSRTNSGVDG